MEETRIVVLDHQYNNDACLKVELCANSILTPLPVFQSADRVFSWIFPEDDAARSNFRKLEFMPAVHN